MTNNSNVIASDKDFLLKWNGDKCIIIGSGKSMDYLPFNPEINKFDGKIIGCNQAFTVGYNVDMVTFTDEHVLNENANKMLLLDCIKITIACDPPYQWENGGNDIHWLKAIPPYRFSDSFDGGFYPADLTGYTALNVAILMGCSEIYLYGFDCNDEKFIDKSHRYLWALNKGADIYVTEQDSYLVTNGIFQYKSFPVKGE